MDASLIEALKSASGPSGWLEAENDKAPYLKDERDLYHGAAPLVLRPATTEQVARIVRLCNDAGIGIVPQGGNTG
jgi:FAD/FMN-containing dehydrogenase